MPTAPPDSYRPRKLDLAFGVVIPGLILGPMLLLGLLGMVVTGTSGKVPNESKDVMGILFAMSIAGLLALSAVAAAVVLGPQRIKQRPVLRIAVIVALLAGMVESFDTIDEDVAHACHYSRGSTGCRQPPHFLGFAL